MNEATAACARARKHARGRGRVPDRAFAPLLGGAQGGARGTAREELGRAGLA